MQKKTIFGFILISILLVLIFNACKNSNEQQEDKTATTTPAVKEEKPVQEPIKEDIIPPINYDSNLWTNILVLDPSIELDIRYATNNNFVGEPIYDCAGCYLRPEVAKALIQVHQDLIEQGYGGIKIFDCYRPRPFQQRLWDKVPDPRFVSNPKKGSMHTRGAAVDLTILDTYGKNLNMGTEFDVFTKDAYHGNTQIDSVAQENRILLKRVMYKRGFKHISTEWWHYSYTLKNYNLSDWVWDCRYE